MYVTNESLNSNIILPSINEIVAQFLQMRPRQTSIKFQLTHQLININLTSGKPNHKTQWD